MEIMSEWGKAIRAELWQFLATVISFAAIATVVGRLDLLVQQGFTVTVDDALCFFKFFACTGMAGSLVYYPNRITVRRR